MNQFRARGVEIEIWIDEEGVSRLRYDEPLGWVVDMWLNVVKQRAVAAATPQSRSFKGKIPPGRCAYCLEMSDNLTRDHVVPVSKGGTDDPDNIVSACQSCNSKKHDSSLLQFVARIGAVS